MTNTLHNTFQELQTPVGNDLPYALPIGHLSVARCFEEILQCGELTPKECKYFNNNLLYFSYGGIRHRHPDNYTYNATQLPIAFLFAPEVLSQIDYYHPYDTGAAASEKYGEDWSVELKDFNKYKILGNGCPRVPRKLIHHIYGSNENYLAGQVHPGAQNLPTPFPYLHKFLTCDLSDVKVDHRQGSIECKTTKGVSLARGLLWVGCGKASLGEYAARLRKFFLGYEGIVPPMYDTYDDCMPFSPRDCATILMGKARERYVNRFLE